MMEVLTLAEQALGLGLLDRAEGLYRQAAEADPRNPMAVTGLSRVALDRGDDGLALQLAWRALAIDPQNAVAVRLVERLEEVLTTRGDALPDREVDT
jgi:tetratricopeptide (TPR) repeat protein